MLGHAIFNIKINQEKNMLYFTILKTNYLLKSQHFYDILNVPIENA